MDFLKDYEINEVSDYVRIFDSEGEYLFLTLKEGTERKLVVSPEKLTESFAHIHSLWMEILDKLGRIRLKLDSMSFFYIGAEFEREADECIQKYVNNLACIQALYSALNEAYAEYCYSGSSGNPANISSVCQWQCKYCSRYPFIKNKNMEFIEELDFIKKEIISKEKKLSMACVYASPEVMQGEVTINESTDTYPFIHAKSFGEENNFEENMMQEIYGSPEMIREDILHEIEIMNDVPENNIQFCMHCGQSLTNQTHFCNKCGKGIERILDPDVTIQFCSHCKKAIPLISTFCPLCGKQMRTNFVRKETPMACVYASPEMMEKPKSKENLFAKIVKRKK